MAGIVEVFTCLALIALTFATLQQAEASRERRSNRITVTTIVEEPYVRYNETQQGNNRFTGFIPELMKKISEEADFDYVLKKVADNKYGMEITKDSWNGMIGEVIKGEAHLAAAPLTISDAREKVIAFTEPFMNLGTVMLMKKPPTGESAINSLEDLTKTQGYSWGVVKDGQTMSFFKNSQNPIYQKVWEFISSHPTQAMLNSNIAGVEKIRKSEKFVFIMENTTASYWMNQEPCDLLMVGKPISERSYGFVTSKADQALNQKVSRAIRNLKESGEMERLENFWWKKDAKCDNAATSLPLSILLLTLGALLAVFY